MILFMMGARSLTGRNPRPNIHRLAARLSNRQEAKWMSPEIVGAN